MENNIKATKENRRTHNFLSVQNLEKIYPNNVKAVYDFNIDISKNEFIVIVGPSGCGKTTTLRMIAGLEDITSGEIYLDNEFINYKPSKDRKMAIVFQSYALYPQMNVYDNIAFPLTINKYLLPKVAVKLQAYEELYEVVKKLTNVELFTVLKTAPSKARAAKLKTFELIANDLNVTYLASKLLISFKLKEETYDKDELLHKLASLIAEEKAFLAADNVTVNEHYYLVNESGEVLKEERQLNKYEIREKVFNTAAILDLGDYLGRLPKELSGGQMQRVALGRAIVKNVPIFLMDEPLSNLDAKLRGTMRSEIVKLHNKIGATTIYVTHDQTEAMTMATRIVVMSKGFIQQIATPQEVYDHPANLFVAKFIGAPTINLFEGRYDAQKKVIQINEKIELKVSAAMVKKFSAFYARKIKELEQMRDNYQTSTRAQEDFLRLLSSLDTGDYLKAKQSKKQSFLMRLRTKITKRDEVSLVQEDELFVLLNNKLAALKEAANNPHNIILGIRPERMNITVQEKDREYVNAHHITPTVTELLGYEYIVHFDFLGEEMTAKIDAKSNVSVASKLMLTFEVNETHFFCPITGEVIK